MGSATAGVRFHLGHSGRQECARSAPTCCRDPLQVRASVGGPQATGPMGSHDDVGMHNELFASPKLKMQDSVKGMASRDCAIDVKSIIPETALVLVAASHRQARPVCAHQRPDELRQYFPLPGR
jgi:hypothetical protein